MWKQLSPSLHTYNLANLDIELDIYEDRLIEAWYCTLTVRLKGARTYNLSDWFYSQEGLEETYETALKQTKRLLGGDITFGLLSDLSLIEGLISSI